MKKFLAVFIFIPFLLEGQGRQIIKPELKKFFDEYKAQGSFMLYDLNNKVTMEYNPAQNSQRSTPASTFKIFNSLVGLETGVIKDQNFVIKWDGIKRWVTAWNQDLNLKDAFKYSAVWYYQEIARRVGREKMDSLIQKEHYGNMNTTGRIDSFWLNNNIKISPKEQISYLERIYKGEVSFSKRSLAILKDIMLREDTLGYKFYYKTGWGNDEGYNIGWLVGYVERDNNVYFFAGRVYKKEDPDFPDTRTKIVMNILKELKLINRQ